MREAEDTRPVNSLSYLPMSKLTKERWSEEDTDKFYAAIRTVGTDFTLIAKYFQGRTRKQVRDASNALLQPRCNAVSVNFRWRLRT